MSDEQTTRNSAADRMRDGLGWSRELIGAPIPTKQERPLAVRRVIDGVIVDGPES